MAGTVTLSEITHLPVKKLSMTWLADGSGDVSVTPSVKSYTGIIERAIFIPDAGGTQPLDNYDVTLLDSDGIDVLIANGTGTNLNNALTIQKDNVSDGLGAIVATTLSLVVENAGADNGGKVIVYIR